MKNKNLKHLVIFEQRKWLSCFKNLKRILKVFDDRCMGRNGSKDQVEIYNNYI